MLEFLMTVHQSYTRLEHIEKHIGEANKLVAVLLSDCCIKDKQKALSSLILEFRIIENDAACALFVLGAKQRQNPKGKAR